MTEQQIEGANKQPSLTPDLSVIERDVHDLIIRICGKRLEDIEVTPPIYAEVRAFNGSVLRRCLDIVNSQEWKRLRLRTTKAIQWIVMDAIQHTVIEELQRRESESSS